MFELFKTKRFLPLFITQFLGAFNDNFFKNALIILVMYKFTLSEETSNIMVVAIAGVFILPYFLFSALAGQLADKYDRSKMTRILKLWEIVLMVGIGIAFSINSLVLSTILIFFMGVQSTFFGPIKYALLPQHLKKDELIAGNALIESGTYIAILLGTVFGGVFIMFKNGETLVSVLLLLMSIAGYISSRFIPYSKPVEPGLKINKNFFDETIKLVNKIRENHNIFLCILGASWFWLIGALFLSQFPALCKNNLNADNTVVTFLLILFSVGVGCGTMWCNKILRGFIQTTYVPLGILGMTIFTVVLYFTVASYNTSPEVINFIQFLKQSDGLLLSFSLFMIAFCGGVYIVPLNALMQVLATNEFVGRVIAANNIINSLFMVGVSIGAAILIKIGFDVHEILLVAGLLNLIVMIYILKLLPDALPKSFIQFILSGLFKVKIEGLENFAAAGKKVIIIANHTSLLDAVLIGAFMPEKITFAINTEMAKKWWVKPFLLLVNFYPLDPTNSMAVKSMIGEINKNKKCMIFPEGRITTTGSLMKVYEGTGLMADKTGAMILPIRINGAQYSKFSYLKKKEKTYWFPKITLKILKPRQFHVDDDVIGRNRRKAISNGIYNIMTKLMYESSNLDDNLFKSLLNARHIYGKERKIVEDIARKPLTYNSFITKSYVIGEALKNKFPEKNIGIMLPNSVAMATVFFGLLSVDKIPAMINYTAGSMGVLSACKTAEIKTILTSRQFIKLGGFEQLEDAILNAGINLIYLEDFAKSISILTKIKGLFKSKFEIQPKSKGNEPAVILFTSGSEGTPKGVVLSHKNLQANRYQISAVMAFNSTDVVFNCLPMFHAFGLGAGTILPILFGIKTFFYPSPLRYRIVPELSYDTNATIIFGTDTFLSGYAKMGHPYDFFSIKYAVCGAEKLKETTAKAWMDKFGIRVLEGYGATEASPVISINTPMYPLRGSVGRILPGMESKLEELKGITDGQKLWIKGDNLMMGYLKADKPGILQPLEDGWYDTGDIVDIDEDGFIFIKGRAKRFAKIGGEMVSLTTVEMAINKLWEGVLQGIIVIPDDRKGEQLILITEKENPNIADIVKYFKDIGLSELWAPKKAIYMKKVPILGTGKFDYVRAKTMVEKGEIK